jgi:polysaccharide biosynthesis transport protein
MNTPPEQLMLPAQAASMSWIVPGRSIEPIASARKHRTLALAIALPMVVLGLTAAMLFGHAQYKAIASVRVLPNYDTRLATGLDPSFMPNIEYRSFVQQQVFEIDNPETMIEAFKLLGPEASLWQEPKESEQHAAERLVDALKVEWIPDTFLISISLQGTKPRGLDEIVNAVVNAYLSRQERQELSGSDMRVKLLEQRRNNLQQQADAERVQLGQLAQELGVSTFTTAASDPYNRKLADANVALEQQQRQLIVEQANLEALRAQQSRPQDADLNSLAQKILLDNQDLVAQKAQLGKQRETTFLELQGLAPNHPGRPVLERQIADINQEISLIDAKAMEQARSILIGTRSVEEHDKISEAQTRVDQAQRARDGIEQEVAALRESVASFGAKYNQALAVYDQSESHRKAISEIDDRIDMVRLQTQSPGVASLELPAQLPDKPEGGKRKEILALSIVLAVLLSIALPTLVDLTDTRIKSSRELERILQMPVLGSIPGSDSQSPRETLRRIALGILRERRRAGTRVFVITAVGEMAGTSSLTLALSNELTELGASTVAVEANALYADARYQKRSTNERTNGSGNGKQLGSASDRAVAQRNPLDGCVHAITKAAGSLPDRIAICQCQKRQRLAMRCFQEVLDLALATHELVLMDAPPILGSADTAMLVQNPAGVIAVVRAERDRVSEITATVQELNKLSPPVVGVVIQRGQFDDFNVVPRYGTERERIPMLLSTESLEMSLPDVSSEDVAHLS